MNIFPRDIIQHFECCDDVVHTSGTPTDDIVSEVKQNNDIEEKLVSAPSFSEVIGRNNLNIYIFFSTENVN